jgi:hypothetical protein
MRSAAARRVIAGRAAKAAPAAFADGAGRQPVIGPRGHRMKNAHRAFFIELARLAWGHRFEHAQGARHVDVVACVTYPKHMFRTNVQEVAGLHANGTLTAAG